MTHQGLDLVWRCQAEENLVKQASAMATELGKKPEQSYTCKHSKLGVEVMYTDDTHMWVRDVVFMGKKLLKSWQEVTL